MSRDGEPVIIDVGVETYPGKTFSMDRYRLWTTQSGYHNLPTINGASQKEGKSCAARKVRYHVSDTGVTLSLDIAGIHRAQECGRGEGRSPRSAEWELGSVMSTNFDLSTRICS